MRNSVLLLVALSLFQLLNAQMESLDKNKQETTNPFNESYFKRINFKIGGGILIPQGNLKEYLKTSPLVELSLDFPVTNFKSIQLAFQFVVPSQNKSFNYVRAVDTIKTKATFMLNPMLRFKKRINKKEKSELIIGIGIGASIINTNARNPFYTGSKEDEEKYEVITSFLVSPTLDYVKTFKSKDQLTFGLSLNYSPYKIEGSVQDNIGSISLVPKIMYSF